MLSRRLALRRYVVHTYPAGSMPRGMETSAAVQRRFSGRSQGRASVIWKSVRLSLKLSPGSSTEPAIAPASTCGLGSGEFCSNARGASAGGLAFGGRPPLSPCKLRSNAHCFKCPCRTQQVACLCVTTHH